VPALLLLVDADEPAPDATDAVRAAALSAIAALAHCSASAPAPFSSALVDAGGLHRLVAAMRVSGDGDLLRDASLALRCVALGGAHHDALRDSGALAQLVSVVWRCASKASPAERAIGAAAEALCAACTNCAANMAELLSDEDFVPLLSALLVPERPKCSIAAAALLMRVVASHGGEAGRKAVRASGGVEALHGGRSSSGGRAARAGGACGDGRRVAGDATTDTSHSACLLKSREQPERTFATSSRHVAQRREDGGLRPVQQVKRARSVPARSRRA
jgi:hypothetical protein